MLMLWTGVVVGLVYTVGGTLVLAYRAPSRELDRLVADSVPRGVLVLVFWPAASVVAWWRRRRQAPAAGGVAPKAFR